MALRNPEEKSVKTIFTLVLAFRMATGKPVIASQTVDNGKIKVPSMLLDVYTVTKENMESTVVEDGFHSKAEVAGS